MVGVRIFSGSFMGGRKPPSEEKQWVPPSLLLSQRLPQEPEEKRIVQELLETEQAYVARLHLLDQASVSPPLPRAQH